MQRWKTWLRTYRSEMRTLIAVASIFAVVASFIGAFKLSANIGGSWLHAVLVGLPMTFGMAALFVAGATWWAYVENRAPLDRAGRRRPRE